MVAAKWGLLRFCSSPSHTTALNACLTSCHPLYRPFPCLGPYRSYYRNAPVCITSLNTSGSYRMQCKVPVSEFPVQASPSNRGRVDVVTPIVP